MSHRASTSTPIESARRFRLSGRVQAVGFRPFVYRLARREALAGHVRNLVGHVEIAVAGSSAAMARFRRALIDEAPPLAAPVIEHEEPWSETPPEGFEIVESGIDPASHVSMPPDFFACEDCLEELTDPLDRRFEYPFISCTQCGPRYTAIERLPFDRDATVMRDFPLCPTCLAEYRDPSDRRYHAEVSACPQCGPSLDLVAGDRSAKGRDALGTAVALLETGSILAAKGVGGYHLLCDAADEAAILRLRARKHRPGKPVALVVPWQGADGLDGIRAIARIGPLEAAALTHPERPIVLVEHRPDSGLPAALAPGLDTIGVFLPYSPLLHALTRAVARPLVATSGNTTGEPIVIDEANATTRLAGLSEAMLHHDRRILRPADDSVRRVIAGRARPIRLGRGAAPLELEAPREFTSPTLALGGHLKNTIALGWTDRIVVSPHIGDMATTAGMETLARLTEELPQLYRIEPARVVCDAHPDYATHRWARRQSLPVRTVLHHHAHASALAGEWGRTESDLVVFTWDGVGLGADGSLWGGETLTGAPGRWRQAVTFRSFPLVGGERAAREPWRVGAVLALLCGVSPQWPVHLSSDEIDLFQLALERGINSPRSSAVGRLFDGAAALTLGIDVTSYEAEAAMRLESVCPAPPIGQPLPFAARDDGVIEIDWRPLVPMLVDRDAPAPVRAGRFHGMLADTIVAVASKIAGGTVGLTGGVFQNRRLTEATAERLAAAGFEVLLPFRVPANDGGLSFGQLVEAACA